MSLGVVEVVDVFVDIGWKLREFCIFRCWIVFIVDNIVEIVYFWFIIL